MYTVQCASLRLVVYYVLSLGKTQTAQLRSVLNRRESNTMRDGIATLSGGAIVGSHTPPLLGYGRFEEEGFCRSPV